MLVRNNIHKILVLLFVFLLITVHAAPLKSEDIPGQLKQIAAYEFGQDREVLANFEIYVHGMTDSPEKKAVLEDQMIDFLQSEATWAGKQFICNQLSLIGTKKSVPVLVKLLKEDETANMALYGLERIADPSVDNILRKMLRKTRGNTRIGIINTLGVRGDIKASKSLKFLLKSKNSLTASAAASALGKIGDKKSAAYLAKAIQKSSQENNDFLLDAYLACADQLLKNNETESAIAIYQSVYSENNPDVFKSAALRGLILTQPQKGLDYILGSIQTDSKKVQAVGFSLIPQLPSGISLQPLYDAMSSISEPGQIQILAALAEREETSAHGLIHKALKSESEFVQIQAVKSLQNVGKNSDVLTLAVLASEKKGAVSNTARDVLYLLKDNNVDQEIIHNIPSADPKVKIELIRSLRERYISEATYILIQVLKDDNYRVQRESYKSLGIIAEPENLNQLLAELHHIKNNSVRTEAENALALVALKYEKGPRRTDEVLAAVNATSDIAVKGSLFMILGKIGEDEGLPVLRKSLQNKNIDLRIAGVKALSDWPNAEPADDLKYQIKHTKNTRLKKLAYRGWIQLLNRDLSIDNDVKVEMYIEAMNLASDDQDKKQVLSALSNVKTKKALDASLPMMQVESLKSEAEMAVYGIAMDLRSQYPEETKAVFRGIIASSSNEQLVNRLKEVLTWY